METGLPRIVLVGLCSGADNAIRLTADNPAVSGLVLMDPVCEKDEQFESRKSRFASMALKTKATTPSRYVPALKRRIGALTQADAGEEGEKSSADSLDLRDIPDAGETKLAFEQVRERGGRILSVFTSYALRYYNEHGQMGRVLGVDGYDDFVTELFWPQMRHTYPLETHRLQLMDEIEAWATR
jgi:dienelactone hydrolase